MTKSCKVTNSRSTLCSAALPRLSRCCCGSRPEFLRSKKLILASRARSFCRLDAADRRATARGGVLHLGTGNACTPGVVVALHLPTTQCGSLWSRGELRDSPDDDNLLCWIVAPPAVTPSAVSGRQLARSLSLIPRVRCSRLRGRPLEHTEEFHVRLDKGIVESGDSLCSYPAGVRSFRMSAKDSPRIPRTRSVS